MRAFRSMITLPLIWVIFWGGAWACVVGGALLIKSALVRKDEIDVVLGGALALFGPFVWRLVCELWVVVFRINQTLTEILEELEKMANPGNQGFSKV